MAGCFILFQGVLSARFKFLDRIYGLNNLMNFHRVAGNLIVGCVVIHPILILASEGVWTIPLNRRYWPEFVGVFLLIGIIGIVITSNFRSALKIPFHFWRVAHRWGVNLVPLTIFVHVSFVSETFESGLPRLLNFIVFGVCFILFLWVRIKAWGLGKTYFQVTSVTPAGVEAYEIKLKLLSGTPFNHAPGQFGFFRFKSLRVKNEEHPFTIASSPMHSDHVELIVRMSGDWTENVKNLESGDTCLLDGPYGIFTPLIYDGIEDIIMIAGGIGITPMLSMLRYMVGNPNVYEQTRILLIWSNQTRGHVVLPDEFKQLISNLKGLTISHVFTRESPTQELPQRLDQSSLLRLLSGANRSAHVFVCGPPKMMKSVYFALKYMGFSKSKIHMEKFSL